MWCYCTSFFERDCMLVCWLQFRVVANMEPRCTEFFYAVSTLSSHSYSGWHHLVCIVLLIFIRQNLMTSMLSRYECAECTNPVADFCQIEPCEDPRATVYLWVSHEGTATSMPLFNMYSVCYHNKTQVQDYGTYYQACIFKIPTKLKGKVRNIAGSIARKLRQIATFGCSSLIYHPSQLLLLLYFSHAFKVSNFQGT